MVGHNPTMASLAALLDDGDGDEEAGNEMALGFPTSAVAVFAYDGDWADLDEASASWWLPRRPWLTASRHVRSARRSSTGPASAAQTGGAGVTMPASASAASISSREMPSR